nr:MAG TPA: hypothetical protein [Caudoviricetes sp.]
MSGELGISRHRIRLCKECFKDLRGEEMNNEEFTVVCM